MNPGPVIYRGGDVSRAKVHEGSVQYNKEIIW